MNGQYIHYGAARFELTKFDCIKNRPLSSKPFGGFWASAVDAKFGWKEWCACSGFDDLSKQPRFCFFLSDSANVLGIKSAEDLQMLPRCSESNLFVARSGISKQFSSAYLDFEMLQHQGYDAIEVFLSDDARLYHMLYGWDCDSILILNPDVILNATDEQNVFFAREVNANVPLV